MNKHTQGPWEVQGDTYVTVNSLIIAHCKQDGHTTLEEAQANARLIAAAPDLLEALEDAEKALWRLEPNMATHQIVQAAIAKAKGE